ncbi:RING-H2 finger protein ATL57-like [Magnolia sinica]|uniref:RING-H2 finger protein ATL57-like n=1 Tax=Magnolia sinica TaxID=86752 RepID=UPI00265A53D3|nr:RING-H2 finger protein ATL57-like [Magnolia sinica]
MKNNSNGRRLLLEEEGAFSNASPSLSRHLPSLPCDNNSISLRKPFDTTSNFDSSMAVTLLVLLTALFFMAFFSVFIRRFAEDTAAATAAASHISRRRRQQQRGLDTTTVGALPLFSYNSISSSWKDPPVDCPVCLIEFEEKETVKMIPRCGHFFHPGCIDVWFYARGSCPLCRSTKPFPSPPCVALQVLEQMPERVVEEFSNTETPSTERECVDEGGGGRGGVEPWIGLRRTNSYPSPRKKDLLRRSCSF